MRGASFESTVIATGEARRLLGVSRQRVHQLVEEGKISGWMAAGRLVISRRSVEARLALLEKEAAQDD